MGIIKKSEFKIILLAVLLHLALSVVGQDGSVSNSLDISELYDSTKPVVSTYYDTDSKRGTITTVEVKITVSDNTGVDKVIISDKSYTANAERAFEKTMTLPDNYDLIVKAYDTNGNETVYSTKIKLNNAIIVTDKVALVIGNSAYTHSAPLKNPKNDAMAMAATLEGLGFEIIKILDATKDEMMTALKAFSNKIAETDVALLYFAGHGMQVNSKNYLIPVDAEFKNGASDVDFESINVEMLTKVMNYNIGRTDRLNMMVLDACRNNPYRKWDRGGASGLARMSAPSGTIVAYSTSPGSVASDGEGENGLYTGELIKQLKISQRIEDIFINTRNAVEEKSNGQQSPWELARLKGKYFLK